MRSRSAPSVRRMPAARHVRAASSHWLRLKMNTIAGSRSRCSRRSIVSIRPGVYSTRRPLPFGRPLVAVAAAHGRGVEAQRVGVGPAALERLEEVQPVVRAVADEVAVVQVHRAGAARRPASSGPRTVWIHAASSAVLDTVADRHTSCTCGGRWTMTSSHTGPRYVSCRKCTSSSTTSPRSSTAPRPA